MFLNFLLSLLGMVLTIFIIVGVHEGAHFIAARLLGVKVLRASIGFGKAFFRWTDKQGTEYVLAPIPLGGYVKLLDENEGEVPEAEKAWAFNRQPLYKRFLIVAAGPFSNLLSAFLLYWLIFALGFQTAIPLIGTVEPHSIASQAGLKAQQEIVSVDQKRTLSWSAVVMHLVMHIGDNDRTTLGVREFKNRLQAPVQFHLLSLENWQMNDLKPDPLSSLGITPYMPEIPLVVGQIQAGSPAAAVLQIGDKLLSLNGKKLKNWEELLDFVNKNPDKKIQLGIARKQQRLELTLTLAHRWNLHFHRRGLLGISPRFELPDNLVQTIQFPLWQASHEAFKEVLNLSHLNLLLFGKLVMNKLSLMSLGGPITIFESAGSAFQYGILPFLSFLAFLNVALGIINLFPIPGLDGGHLLFQAIEALIQRPISLRVQIFCYRLGFIFLLLILVQALTNDLLRLWG